VLLNRVDTATAPDIEWPTNAVREESLGLCRSTS
ncbi:tail fiber assembly protein, partial [Escherichia coli]